MAKIPKFGYYYHYKHLVNGPVNHHAYFVLGIAQHTEADCRPLDKQMVVYTPLYKEAPVYKKGKFFDIRPVSLFLEPVQKDGKTIARFRKIKDEKIIKKLRKIAREIYPEYSVQF